jgi:hypothetical protein
MRSYLISSIITYPDKFDFNQIKAAHNVIRTIKTKASYEATFLSTTNHAEYLRRASAYRYNKTELVKIKAEKKPKDEDMLRTRYRGLNFRLFCFVAPYLTDTQIASITDDYWEYVVEQISAHIREIKIPQFAIVSDRKKAPKPTFLELIKARLSFSSPDLAEAFEREWNQEYTIWTDYENRLQTKTELLKAAMKQSLKDIAERNLPFNERLEVNAQLVTGYKNQHTAISTQLMAEVRLDEKTYNEYKCQVENTITRLETELENGLAAALHDGSFDKSLDQTLRLLENVKLEEELETAKHLKEAIEASPGL